MVNRRRQVRKETASKLGTAMQGMIDEAVGHAMNGTLNDKLGTLLDIKLMPMQKDIAKLTKALASTSRTRKKATRKSARR